MTSSSGTWLFSWILEFLHLMCFKFVPSSDFKADTSHLETLLFVMFIWALVFFLKVKELNILLFHLKTKTERESREEWDLPYPGSLSNDGNNQDWARPKQRARNVTWSSMWIRGTQLLWASPAPSQDASWRSWVGMEEPGHEPGIVHLGWYPKPTSMYFFHWKIVFSPYSYMIISVLSKERSP